MTTTRDFKRMLLQRFNVGHDLILTKTKRTLTNSYHADLLGNADAIPDVGAGHFYGVFFVRGAAAVIWNKDFF